MNITKKLVYLGARNGTETKLLMVSPKEQHTEEVLQVTKQIFSETPFLTMSAEDFTNTVADERDWILQKAYSSTECVIGAFVQEGDKSIYVGNLLLHWSKLPRLKHLGRIGIAILQKYTNRGIGTALLRYAESIARDNGIEILELSVIEGNTNAISCYMKQGYCKVGARQRAIKYKDGTYAQVFILQKYL